MHRDTPVALLWVLATTGLGGGALIWGLRFRLRDWMMHTAVALAGVLIALLARQPATAVGIVGLGPALIAVGLFAAHFLALPAARLHAALLVVLATAGAVAAEPDRFAASWVPIVVSVVALTETHGRLARNLRRAATTDSLTGVANRRAWEAEAARHLARAERAGEPLSVAILRPRPLQGGRRPRRARRRRHPSARPHRGLDGPAAGVRPARPIRRR